MEVIYLSANKMVGEEGHDYIAEKLHFPEYYGKNLDALYDCLTELSNIKIVIVNIDYDDPELTRILDVFEEASWDNGDIEIVLDEEE